MKALSLFSGIGGLDLAAEACGIETVAFCEIEEFPVSILKKRWPSVPIYDDVRKIKGSEILGRLGAIDVVHGGFPCQDLSVAGKRAGLVCGGGGIQDLDSGTRCSASSPNCDLVLWLVKMYVERSASHSTRYTGVWKLKTTKSGRSSFLHLQSVRRTSGKGSLSSGSEKTSSTLKESTDNEMSQWPTVTSSCGARGCPTLERMEKVGRNPMTEMLDTAVKAAEHKYL